MDQLRRIMANISEQLKKLSASHKLAIASTVLLMLTLLFVVAQWTAKPDLVEVLPTASTTEQNTARNYLETAGFKLHPQNGKLMIATADASRARAMLAESGQMPRDKTLLFENLIEKNSWTNSRQQNEMNYLNALMNELAITISNFKGIKSAKVIIDVPEPTGLGAAVRKPTASATVWTTSGESMPQTMVDAVANFIAGSRAGLDVSRVRVIDGNSGRQRKAQTEDDALSNSYLEHAARVEGQTREKVLDLLSYIPGVIVAVTAQVDVTKVTSNTQSYLKEDEGSVVLNRKSTDITNSSSDAAPGGEPGPASNVTADINRGTGAGSRTDSTESTVENETHAGVKNETVVDPKGHPTMVAVSVNVPKGFVASLVKPAAGGAGDAPAAPSDADVEKEFLKLQDIIQKSIRPQVRAMTVAANSKVDPKAIEALVNQSISVALIPDLGQAGPGAAAQPTSILTSLASGGSGGGLGGGVIEKVVLGLLAMVAMGMMVMMVRKAGKKTDMPTAEELVGLPPALETQGDVIGEADEGEMAMEGIEVGDAEMQSQKMLQTVSEMVESNPDSAAKMLNRWIDVDD